MRRPAMKRGLDVATMKQAIAGPGMDTRTWVTYATVADQNFLEFDPDYGPLVTVVTQPNKTILRCRVGMDIAGDGEGDYYPFVAGDEVLVLLPEGSERSDCVILCRFANSLDKFPIKNVAGQDPSTNSFGFRRQRAPFVHEVLGPYMLRSAISGAFISLDTKGTLTLRDGQGGAIQMSADTFGYQGPGASGPGSAPDHLFQMDLTGHRMTMQVGDALLTLSGSKASPSVNALAAPSGLTISAASQPAAEHVLTTESMLNVLAAVFNQLAIKVLALGPPLALLQPIFANELGAPPGTFSTSVAAAMLLAAETPQSPLVAAAIKAAFALATQKPPAGTNGQELPGVGCVGVLAG